jgi:hypothetical protein
MSCPHIADADDSELNFLCHNNNSPDLLIRLM